jgi:hypothetical protein
MTVETVTTIELKDLSAVEFDCKRCGAKTVRNTFTCSRPEQRLRACTPV